MTPPTPRTHRLVRGRAAASLLLFVACALATVPRAALAQDARLPAGAPGLSLDDAIRLAEAKNENVMIAEAGVERARADDIRARSLLMPQLTGSASYDRTLATEFASEFTTPALPAGCSPYVANPAAPVAERVGALEQAVNCGTLFSGLFSGLNSLPFGRENIYRLNLSFSQNLYSGGRIGAQRALAAAGRQLATSGLSAARAQLVLDVTQAYYDAALSDRMVTIAESSLRQAEATASLVELGFKAGRQPEFELLRARVARDNQRPTVIRAQSQRTLAYMRLRQLLNLPDSADLRTTVDLDDPVLAAPPRFAAAVADAQARQARDDLDARAPVRQALQGVAARQASVQAARAERWPSVTFSSAYGRVAYPSALPRPGDFLTNWTVGAAAQVPILTGGRIHGGEVAAQADLLEARARLDQARKLARLDSQSAMETLRASEATWQSSAGTVEQAQRAYEIAELRYREGVSTQLELSDARLLLDQAQANRAQAARDLQVARAHVALLPDLPLSASPLPSLSASGPSASGSSGSLSIAGSNGTGLSNAGRAGAPGGAGTGAAQFASGTRPGGGGF